MDFIMNGLVTDNLKGRCDIKKANNMAIKGLEKNGELKFSYIFGKVKDMVSLEPIYVCHLINDNKLRSLIFLL